MLRTYYSDAPAQIIKPAELQAKSGTAPVYARTILPIELVPAFPRKRPTQAACGATWAEGSGRVGDKTGGLGLKASYDWK